MQITSVVGQECLSALDQMRSSSLNEGQPAAASSGPFTASEYIANQVSDAAASKMQLQVECAKSSLGKVVEKIHNWMEDVRDLMANAESSGRLIFSTAVGAALVAVVLLRARSRLA